MTDEKNIGGFMQKLAEMSEEMEPFYKAEGARANLFSKPLIEQLRRKGVELKAGPYGQCPVQVNGKVDDKYPLYFRARGEHWRLHIAPTDSEILSGSNEWVFDQEYPGGEFSAGWMTHEEAVAFIMFAIRRFRVWSVGKDNPFEGL